MALKFERIDQAIFLEVLTRLNSVTQHFNISIDT